MVSMDPKAKYVQPHTFCFILYHQIDQKTQFTGSAKAQVQDIRAECVGIYAGRAAAVRSQFSTHTCLIQACELIP